MKQKSTILIVDDEPSNCISLEQYLKPEGYEIYKAYCGEDAIKKIESDSIDLVLMDVKMPGIDGFEVTRQVRMSEKNKMLPIVLITALMDTNNRIEGINAGCDDFISKPFSMEEVLARVKSLLKMNYYRSLLDDKEKFEYIIENMEDGVILLNRDHRVVKINQRAKELLGTKCEGIEDLMDCLGKIFRIHYNGDFKRDIILNSLTFELERPETEKVKSLYIELRSRIIKNIENEVSSIIMILRDITERYTENALKMNFLDFISHKLRTPVNNVSQGISIIKEELYGGLEEKYRKIFDIIYKSAGNMNAQIEKLISYTKMTGEEKIMPNERVNVFEYFMPIADGYKKYNRNLRIDIDCADRSICVNVNKKYLGFIFDNLLENAVRFNDKKTAEIKITIRKRKDKGSEINIEDNGPGIPPEEKGKIFEKFYQVEKYFTGNSEGMGLGLALVKHIVDKIGGGLELESNMGKGSVFTVILPLGTPESALQ